MAKQYQSIGGVVNEPSDTQREYQSVSAVVQTQDIASPAGQPLVKRYSGIPHMRRGSVTFGHGWSA